MRKTVVLRCTPARAFVLFTQHAAVLRARERRYRSGIRRRASVEPAMRLVLDWYPGTGPAEPTRGDVLFEAVDASTRITSMHAPGATRDQTFGRNAAGYARSWDLVLAAVAAAEAALLNIW